MTPWTRLVGGTTWDLSTGGTRRRDLWVRDGRIGPEGGAQGDTALALHRPEATVDCSGCLLVPGFTCAHTHLYSSLARGMPPPSPAPRDFREVLARVWWRLDRALDLPGLRASARAGLAEAALCGTTALVDHHESPSAIEGSLDVLREAAGELGIRLVTGYGATERNGGRAEARAGIAESVRAARDHPPDGMFRALVALHAGFTVSDETLAEAGESARAARVGVHLHVAEDACDGDDARARGYPSLFERLAVAGALPPGSLLAHGVHLGDGEQDLLRGAPGLTVVHNPASNLNNAVGYARLPSGLDVALGTDGIGADMPAEARAAFLTASSAGWHEGAAAALRRLDRGRTLSAALLGIPPSGVEPGDTADLVVLEYDPPTPLDPSNTFGHVLFGISSRHVRDVMIGGRWVVRDRRLVTADGAEIAARGRQAATTLWARMADL